MKTFFSFLLLFSLQATVFSQQRLEWFRSIGSTGVEEGTSVILDAEDNVIHCGIFSNTVDLDPDADAILEVTSQGGTDGYICKMDRYGQFHWAVAIGGTEDDYCRDVDVDSLGNVYVVGVFRDTLFVADTTLIGSGDQDIFLVKFSPTGQFIWAQSFGDMNMDDAQAIDVHPIHGVHICGSFSSTVDFDNGPGVAERTSIQYSDIFVLKLDHDGQFQWVVQNGGGLSETGEGVGVFDDGSVVNTGNFRDPVDFDPGEGVAELTGYGNDFYMQKLDVNGDFIWAKQIGGSSEDIINDLALDQEGNILMAGEFKNSCDFDPGPGQVIVSSNGIHDIFMCKYDSDGNYIWADQVGGVSNDAAYGIAADATGRFYATGFFSHTVDIIPGPGEEIVTAFGSSRDMLIFAFEPDGTHIETMRMVSNSDGNGRAVAADSQGQIYMTGYFVGPTDFDPSEGTFIADNVGTNLDTHILKLSLCPTVLSNPVVNACTSYTFEGEVLTLSGTYESMQETVDGCDSLITLDLTINEPTSAEIAVTACDSVTINGETFTEFGTYTQTLTNVAGCDSTLTIDYSLHIDSTFVEALACKAYILGADTLTQSGMYVDTLVSGMGCDSLLFIDLTIEGDSLHEIQILACGEYMVGDSTHLESTVLTDTLLSASGCDSILVTVLTIAGDSIYQQSVSACSAYLFGEVVLTESGSYTDTLSSVAGCDSILVLDLQIDLVDTEVVSDGAMLSADPLADAWQWIDCLDDLAAIDDATDAEFAATYNSDFAVIVEENGCTDTSECVTIIVDAIAEELMTAISIYPNPSTGILRLDHSSEDDLGAVLTDASGKVIWRRQGVGTRVDLSSVEEGVYLLTLSSGKGSYSERIVIQR